MFKASLNSSSLLRAGRLFSTSSLRADVARMTLLGRVIKTPEKLVSKNGFDYMRYPLAVNHSKDNSSIFNVFVFDQNLQEFVTKWVDKGSLVYVEADASINKYETETGANNYSLSLVQQSISPVTWPKRDEAPPTGESAESAQ